MKRLLLAIFIIFALISIADMKKKDKKKNNNKNEAPLERRAIVQISGLSIEGNVTFTQEGDGAVHIYGTLLGLNKGRYGFHIHEKGDVVGDDCMRTGPHFNPHKTNHGGPIDVERHVGDLGNIEFDNNEVAHIDFYDSLISLAGENSIIGRGLVVHERNDDIGRGGDLESLKTGNAGLRVGCGVVGIM